MAAHPIDPNAWVLVGVCHGCLDLESGALDSTQADLHGVQLQGGGRAIVAFPSSFIHIDIQVPLQHLASDEAAGFVPQVW